MVAIGRDSFLGFKNSWYIYPNKMTATPSALNMTVGLITVLITRPTFTSSVFVLSFERAVYSLYKGATASERERGT